jgi:hypothetical protein
MRQTGNGLRISVRISLEEKPLGRHGLIMEDNIDKGS